MSVSAEHARLLRRASGAALAVALFLALSKAVEPVSLTTCRW
jgi:hypothetical protein